MEKLFQIATTISTPLALGGLFAVIFFFIIKQMLAKDVFPRLTKSSAFNILKTIVDRLFVLALIAMLLGFAGYIIPILLPAIFSQKSLPQASSNDPPKFRVRYFDVGGYGIDFLMKGMVDEKMEKDLAGQPFIVPNEVFKEMKFLTGKFSRQVSLSWIENLNKKYIEMDVKGNYLALSYNDIIFEINADNNMLESISDADWNFSWGETSWWKGKDESILKKGAMYANDFSFWRFANQKYLQQFYSHEHDYKEINLYEYITRKYLPSDFHIIQLIYSGCPTLWKLFLVTRGAILQ